MSRFDLAAAILFMLPVSVVAAGARQGPGAPPSEGTRHVYFTVVDRKGDPVTDLSANELTIREDGAERAVVGVLHATAPLQIALLVDDSGPGLRFIREGAGMFIQRLGGLGDVALTSTGGKNTLLVDFTRRVDDLYRGVRQLTTRNIANAVDGAYLLDAVHDAIDALSGREPERPAIVVLTLESAEFSSRRADRLLDELQRSRAVLHVVSLGKPTLKAMSGWNEGPMQSLRENLDENMNRKKFLEDGVRQSGGTFAQVLVDSGVPAAMNGVAVDLASQYVAVYKRSGGQEPRKINVAVKRAGVKVRARTELPRVIDSK
jgi:VWFA-related protein